MTKQGKIILISVIAVVTVAVIIGALMMVNRQAAAEATPEPTAAAVSAEPTAEPTATPIPTQTPEPTPEETESATIAVGGDVVMHTGLNTEAQTGDTYDYKPIFGTIADDIAGADYAVCSLVTTFSGGTDYSSYPLFRSPDSLAASLAGVGFDLVNTATSHAVDSYKAGIDNTLDVLDSAGLAHVGTYRTQAERDAAHGITTVALNGISVAFLSYTCDTNQIPVAGFEYAVNCCTTDYLSGAATVNYDLIAEDMSAARESGADIIFVFMSWGDEFETAPSDLQNELADYLFKQGADVIVGGHTRVPQPMETREVTDVDGNTKTGYICYSLGNLISCQNDAYTNISAIMNITLSKGVDSGNAWVSDVSYKPIYMVDLYDYSINDYGWHYRLADLHAAIDAYDAGQPWAFMTGEIYSDMVTALDDLHTFFGPELDPHDTAQ
jgi:poly-gamma-glutamate synthesis protein (capsule biosynthesis protein)